MKIASVVKPLKIVARNRLQNQHIYKSYDIKAINHINAKNATNQSELCEQPAHGAKSRKTDDRRQAQENASNPGFK